MTTLGNRQVPLRLLLLSLTAILVAVPLSAQADRYQPEVGSTAVQELEQARALRRGSDPQDAVERLEKLVERQPDYYLAWYNLGLAKAQTNDLKSSIEALNRALEIQRVKKIEDPTLLNSLGWAHFLHGDFLAAKPFLERALERPGLPPSSRTKALNNLGAVLLRLQEYEAAEDVLQEATELGSSRAETNLKVLDSIREVTTKSESGGPGG